MKVEHVFCEVFVAYNGRKPGYKEYKTECSKKREGKTRRQKKIHTAREVKILR